MKTLTFPILVILTLISGQQIFGAQSTARQMVLEAMEQRPNDPWPRGQGHVLLATPGVREESKAYHEPGGSFSPTVGSFGVSYWITDAQGRIIATSDDVPLDQVRQSLTWPERRGLPGIRTETLYYEARWSGAGPGRWQLELKPRTNQRITLVVRSVGPAGGAITSLDWDGRRLDVNNRWRLVFARVPRVVEIGHEGEPGWMTAHFGGRQWSSPDGWGVARFDLPGDRESRLTITDNTPPPTTPLKVKRISSRLNLDLPDQQFIESLDAQVAHLMMGLVGRETRPGEPINYPINWLRDGAYVIVALARAGQLDVAKELAKPFAENDFFGGFGAEADGPGLALWAICEVAEMARDPKFDRWLWPHVQRKIDRIQEMLAATQPVRKPYAGPIVPQHTNRAELDLVCDAAKDGLIVGRMDWHRPVLFVNAVSYRGLLSAASVAERLNHSDEAGPWRARAAALREAWNKAFPSPSLANERNFICGMYPAWIVSDTNAFEKGLAAQWKRTHDGQGQLTGRPLWTYFNIAHAHQWLVLGQPARAWIDLQWFWQHQASPGLYTWWEGNGEENSFRRWEQVRGWVKPAHVTPHYWTASEMLLLQLDMLAYLDESGAEPTLVIGAGVPKEWLSQPLAVEGLGTRLGQVGWRWKNGTLKIELHGQPCRIKLGPAFPTDCKQITKCRP